MDDFGPRLGRNPDGSAQMEAHACPVCRKKLNAASEAGGDDALPEPGDFTICINCAGVLCFDAGMVPRRVGKAKLATLPRDERNAILGAVYAVKMLHKNKTTND